MPILDLKQRYQDSFRIRLGDKSGKNGAMKALTDRIRITAPNRGAVEAFAEKYGEAKGGEVGKWEDEWQVYLPITGLPIWIMPGESLSQWWELYRGKVCDRRCDGDVEQLTKVPCLCPADIEERIEDTGSCKPMSRISVVCPEVAILGTGALVTHSRIAAETFPTAITLASRWLSHGRPVSAVLRVLTHKGRTIFTFPTIEILGPAEGFEDLEIDAGASASPAIETGSKRAGSLAAPPAPPSDEFTDDDEKLIGADVRRAWVAEMTEGGWDDKVQAAAIHRATKGRTDDIRRVEKSEWERVGVVVDALIAGKLMEAVVDGDLRLVVTATGTPDVAVAS